MRTQEPIRQCFVFAQQAQQKVFGLDVRRAELAGFVTSKKDYSPRLFCVAFKHVPPCERPLFLPPSLLNGPGCVFYRCADLLVCSSGRTYLYLLLFNTSLRVSFSITSALVRSSVLRAPTHITLPGATSSSLPRWRRKMRPQRRAKSRL